MKKYMFNIGLLVVSLGIAFWASLPKSEGDSGETVWARISKNDIDKIIYESKSEKAEVYRNNHAANKLWVHYVEKAQTEGTEDIITDFMGSDKLVAVLEMFEPLHVKRVIGAANSVKDEEFGFTGDDAATLTILNSKGEKMLDFLIGKRSFGSRNYFVRDEIQGKVVLFNGSRIEDLSKAKTRMYERRPFEVDFNDLDHAELTSQGQSKILVKNRQDKEGMLGWSDDNADAAVKESYNGWLRKVQNLRVVHFAKEEPSNAQLVFQLRLSAKGKTVEDVHLVRTAGEEGKFDYWVKSLYMSSFAKVDPTRAETIEKDIPLIFGDS